MNKKKDYQVCTRCVMDTTDPDIFFDENGICNHCHEFDQAKGLHNLSAEEAKHKLDEVVAMIKKDGQNKSRIVHGDKELREKLGRNDPCPCGSGRRF